MTQQRAYDAAIAALPSTVPLFLPSAPATAAAATASTDTGVMPGGPGGRISPTRCTHGEHVGPGEYTVVYAPCVHREVRVQCERARLTGGSAADDARLKDERRPACACA